MLGSTTRELGGVETTSAVTRAPMALASAMPCFIAALDNSDPSVGSRICLYMRLLPPPCWDGIGATGIDMNQAPARLRRTVTARSPDRARSPRPSPHPPRCRDQAYRGPAHGRCRAIMRGGRLARQVGNLTDGLRFRPRHDLAVFLHKGRDGMLEQIQHGLRRPT